MAASAIPISFTESRAAFVKRALEVGLAQAEVDHLVAAHIDTLSKLAFVLVPPGKVPEDSAVSGLLPSTSNQGSVAGLKRLLFEAHTLIVSELKQRVEKADDSAPVSLNGAERETRLEAQKLRLGGLSFQGEEEVAHDAYNLVYAMIQKDDLVWLSPEKFGTRRSEISAKKQGKELIIDGSGLAIKEKQTNTVCSLASDLELVMALRRRALAFDLLAVSTFNTINKYHQALAQRLQEPPPPGYSKVSLQQLIRADRAVFLRASELTTTLKRSAGGQLPLDNILSTILLDPSVAYHLLPLPVSAPVQSRPRKGRGLGQTLRQLSEVPSCRGLAKSPEVQVPIRRPTLQCPRSSWANSIRPPRDIVCAGASTCRVVAPMPSRGANAPGACTCVRSLGVSNPIPCSSTPD